MADPITLTDQQLYAYVQQQALKIAQLELEVQARAAKNTALESEVESMRKALLDQAPPNRATRRSK